MSEIGRELDKQSHRLDDQAIAEYLQENPDFFHDHPDLLGQLSVRHEERGSISLVERKQAMLREKVGALEEEITSLMAHARRNERIFETYSDLYKELLQATDIEAMVKALETTFIEKLGLVEISLKLFNQPSNVDASLSFNADTHKQLISKRFVQSPVYLGRLTQAEQQLLFKNQTAQSVALLLLQTDSSKLGLVAVGSHDASHFEPGMDYLLISQLQTLLSYRLTQLA